MKKRSSSVIAKKARKHLKAQVVVIRETVKSKPVKIVPNKVLEHNSASVHVRTLIEAGDLD